MFKYRDSDRLASLSPEAKVRCMVEQKKIDLIILVGDQHVKKIHEVAKRLREAGLEIKDILEAAGTVTGSAMPDKKAALSAVPGVAAIEEARAYRLPPPDADVQ